MRLSALVYASTALALAFGAPLSAQQEQPAQQPVRGRVLDAATGKPLAGVLVSVAGVEARVFTDKAGTFALPPGRMAQTSVEFRMPGYAMATLPVTEGTAVPLEVSLAPDTAMQKALSRLLKLLQRRRDQLAVPQTRVFTTADLAAFSGEDMEKFWPHLLRQLPRAGSCRSSGLDSLLSHGTTIFNSGIQARTTSADSLFHSGWIDERPLADLRPFRVEDFYLIEAFPCNMIRFYTAQWIVESARIGLKPLPLR